jgi:hypothetical protein
VTQDPQRKRYKLIKLWNMIRRIRIIRHKVDSLASLHCLDWLVDLPTKGLKWKRLNNPIWMASIIFRRLTNGFHWTLINIFQQTMSTFWCVHTKRSFFYSSLNLSMVKKKNFSKDLLLCDKTNHVRIIFWENK